MGGGETMRGDEVRDTAALLGTALGELADVAAAVHHSLAERVFGLLGAPGAPVRAMHDAIAGVAYGSARLGVRVVPSAAGGVASAMRSPEAQSALDAARGRFAFGAINGFWGDRLAEQLPSLAPPMRLRTHEGRLRRAPVNVVHDVGAAATGRVVVFLHGLCESDLSWWLGAEKHWGERNVTYGSLLRDADGWTPLYLSYNSGLHISANGRELADQLETLATSWPVPLTEIALVGHSMGGLVARSAGHQGTEFGHAWVSALRHIVGLGVPHLGAPLERFVNAGTHALDRLPETRPFATWLNRRSVGIKDLRYGAVLEADWVGVDPDERLRDRCTPATLLPGVAYSCVSATLSRNPHGILAHDLLVAHSSSTGAGRTRRIEFDPQRSFHLGRKHHFALLGDPLVYDQLRHWLAGADGAALPKDSPVMDWPEA
ncbi:MAG: esterase/lipase family protein [Jatrophihabitantaceae bacterium]